MSIAFEAEVHAPIAVKCRSKYHLIDETARDKEVKKARKKVVTSTESYIKIASEKMLNRQPKNKPNQMASETKIEPAFLMVSTP